MSSMIASGASLSIVTSNINKYIQLLQDSYEKISKSSFPKGGFTYKDFYTVLLKYGDELPVGINETDEIRAVRKSEQIKPLRTTLATELYSVIKTRERVKTLEDKLNKEQIAGVKRILAGLALLYIVVVISLVLGAYASAKPYFYAGKLMKGVQILCIFAIILTIASVVISLLSLNSRFQLKEADVVKKTIDNRFKIIDQFIFGIPNQVPNYKQVKELLAKLDDAEQNSKKTKEIQQKALRTFFNVDINDGNYDTQYNIFWNTYIINVIKNIHREGTGISQLILTESKSDPVRILQGTNNILENYYKLMLKTYQSPEANISNEAILNILDNTVIKELKRVDFTESASSYSNTEIVEKLKGSIYFSLIKAGFKHVLTYMYLPWKLIDYKKLMKVSFPNSEQAKSFNVTVDDNEKSIITTFVANDIAAKEVIDRYPMFRSNYLDEFELLKSYSNSISTQKQKDTIDAYIALSVAKFTDVYDTQNKNYFDGLRNADIPNTDKLFKDYIASFNPYFKQLYSYLIDYELMNWNPDKSQFFIFDSQFMREIIEEVVDNNTALKSTEAKYRFYMTDALLSILVEEQKNQFVSSYYDYNAEGVQPNAIKSNYITKRVAEITKTVASAIAPYQVTVSNYNNYVSKKVFESSQINPFLTSLVDNVLLQVDFEASLIRKMKPTLQDDDETRFVVPQNFIAAINSFKYETFRQSLRVDDLQEILKALDVDQSDMFLEKEKSLAKSRILLTGAVFICLFGYIVYMTLTHSKFPDISSSIGSLSKDDAFAAFQNLDNEQLKSANTTIIREIFISGVPFAIIVLFIAIFTSFVEKKKTELRFNKERITQNTNAINVNVGKLKTMLEDITKGIKKEDLLLPIKDISTVTEDDKMSLYLVMRSILSNYDKCNFIIGNNQRDLPFPYADVFADGLMVGVIICAIVYILFKFAPIERLTELKDLYEYKETAETLVNDPSFIKEISVKYSCHADNVESIMMTVRLLFATSIIVFMFMYTIRVVNSTNMYRIGLYNSKYFQKSRCCN